MTRARRIWVWLHKWTGILLGAELALIGLTGSALVFYREIDVGLNPAFYRADDGKAPLPAADILRIARDAAPSPVFFLVAPDGVCPVWTALRQHEGYASATYVTPGGIVLGNRSLEGTLAYTLNQLHAVLLLRDWWGRELVGVLGVVALLSAATGLYLWWPRRGFWRALVTVHRRPRQRLYLDLHNLAGVWTSLALLVVSFSGVAIVLPGLVAPLVGLASPARPFTRPVVPARDQPYAIDASQAVALAQAHVPGAHLTYLQPPRPPGNVYRMGLQWADMNSADRYGFILWLDPWTGTVVQDSSPGAVTAGDRFMAVQFQLHNGSLLGGPGRALVFLSGLSLPALFVTGILLWLRKRHVRRALQGARAAALRVPGPPHGQRQ